MLCPQGDAYCPRGDAPALTVLPLMSLCRPQCTAIAGVPRAPARHAVTTSTGPSPPRSGSRPHAARGEAPQVVAGIRDELPDSLDQLCRSRARRGRRPVRSLAPPFKGRTNPWHRCGEGECCGQRLGELCGAEEPNPTTARAREIPAAGHTPRRDYPPPAGPKPLKPAGSGRVNLPLVQ